MRQYIYHIKARSPAGERVDVFGSIRAKHSSDVEKVLKKENKEAEIRTIIRMA